MHILCIQLEICHGERSEIERGKRLCELRGKRRHLKECSERRRESSPIGSGDKKDESFLLGTRPVTNTFAFPSFPPSLTMRDGRLNTSYIIQTNS
jgi:hypothetical protein